MSRVIYKFPLDMGQTTIGAPTDARVVLVQSDPADATPTIWLELDADAECYDRTFRIYGTGHRIDCDDVHRGSFVAAPFVWHVYEVVR